MRARSPEAYLDRLATLFEKQRRERRARVEAFIADLRQVYPTTRTNSLDDATLRQLGDRLARYRAATQERMKTYVGRIPKDDPLHCPISLFGALDYGRLETAHTRALTWLLDPSKEHGFGDSLLRALMAQIANFQDDETYLIHEIAAERKVGDDWRLDVMVRGSRASPNASDEPSGWILVIEAKVDATESAGQLAKYERWLSETHADLEQFRVFLTPEGRKPESAASDDWKCLSFAQLAGIFRAKYAVLVNQPGYYFLRYYLTGVLKDICRWQIPLPLLDPELCNDPYSYVDYLATICPAEGRAQ